MQARLDDNVEETSDAPLFQTRDNTTKRLAREESGEKVRYFRVYLDRNLGINFRLPQFHDIAALLSTSLRWRSFQVHSLDTASGFEAGNLIV